MLKKLLESSSQLVVPGVYDALSSHIASRCGFKVLYMSGFAVAGSLLAKPDIGLVTASEMAERARQVVDAAGGLPVIADGDNGYGGEHNVSRLVSAYQSAGVQCIQLEDQVNPKRCGHMENKQVVPLEEAVSKIEMAVKSRSSDEFLVMARTDARATHDLNEAIRRGQAFVEAGADILFIEAPGSIEEMTQIKAKFPSIPLVANMVEEGKTPELSAGQLEELGFQILLRPVSALLSAAKSLQMSYQALQETSQLDKKQPRFTFDEFNKLVGLDEFN
jgi:2-methylisocitrate lyase-like PEP mutase family enzyme